MPSEDHQRAAARTIDASDIRCTVLTVSDTRTEADDYSGVAIVSRLDGSGFAVTDRVIEPDDPVRIESRLEVWSAAGIDAILMTGGTGIAPRDVTVDVVQRRLTRELPGFGEIFRSLSYEQIGPAAMLSRALGGIWSGPEDRQTAVFVMPGSTAAVELAMDQLILPQLKHLIWLLRG